ncbi:hypothetical protein BIS06_14035, partial [Halomonas sp. BBD48]|nr:hypothetical protein [Halomonas sp. BBD48]
LLRQRFEGHAPDIRHGVARDDNFIERVLAAIEQDDELLMTLQDVEEMIVLAFELISGRRIPMLTFEYRGRWRLAQALDALEKSRARYRIAQATGLSRLKALTAYLAEQSGTLIEDAATGLRAEVLEQRAVQALDALTEQTQHLAHAVASGQTERKSQLRYKADQLATAIRLYRTAYNAYAQVGRDHVQVLKAAQRWENVTAGLDDRKTRLRLGPGRRGLRIREHVIALNDAAKAEVCKHLARYLGEVSGEVNHLRNGSRIEHERLLTMGIDAAKRLAIEIALALEPHIQLSRPEVQRAINSTNAADFGQLELNLSAAAKAALGAAMVKEIDVDLSRPAESLALALVRHYRVDLDPAAKDFLVSQYGAREATLNMLSNYLSQQSRSPAHPVSYLSQRPPVVNAPQRDWYRALVRARRALR